MQISELFHSIQGEGYLTGRPMYFIRAQGCAVKCPIREVCDQPESLNYKGGTTYAPADLAGLALAAVGPRGWVCLTGGEPAEHADFEQVIAECRRLGLRVNLQTSGLRRVNATVDWITVSPKASLAQLALNFAHELKIVYTGQSIDEIASYYTGFSAVSYYLQPCWREDSSNQADTLEMVYTLNRRGMAFEFTAQWHKFLGVH